MVGNHAMSVMAKARLTARSNTKGVTTNAIVCLNVNTHYMNVVGGGIAVFACLSWIVVVRQYHHLKHKYHTVRRVIQSNRKTKNTNLVRTVLK